MTFASPSTLTVVDSDFSAFRYADGKTLKGIGTCWLSGRCGASWRLGGAYSCFKIQFAGVGSLSLEYPSNRSKTIRKESRKNFLAPLGVSLGEEWKGEELLKGSQLYVLTCSN